MIESQYNADESGIGQKKDAKRIDKHKSMGWRSKPSADTDSVDWQLHVR